MEFRNGTYDKYGRQLGFLETTFTSGTYLDNGESRELSAVSVRERLGNYTKYNGVGQLYSYKDIMTDANGAVSESYQTDTLYDIRNRVEGYTQETLGADGRVGRVEVSGQKYNNLSQVIAYKQIQYDYPPGSAFGAEFYMHGYRSKTVTDRRNTLYNAFGQATFYDEISETFNGNTEPTSRDFTTYRGAGEMGAPIEWLNGNKFSYTALEQYNSENAVVDYEVVERDGEGHVLTYLKKIYADDNGKKGALITAEAVKNVTLDEFGVPLYQKRTSLALGAVFDLAAINWEGLETFSAYGTG
ncbi:MAG: hypothetical protein ACD_77C00122G0001, partial [uncultured bacterium]